MRIIFGAIKTPFSVVSGHGKIILGKNTISLGTVLIVGTYREREGEIVLALVTAVYVRVMEAVCC